MNTKNLMDISYVSIQLEKIKMYVEEEIKCLEKLKTETTNVFQSCHPEKFDKMNSANQNTNNVIDKIIEKRKRYIEILLKNITSYETSAIQTNNIFNNISEGEK